MKTPDKALIKFGKNLKLARNKQGLSQEKLAFITGFDRTYISMLERGLRNPPLTTIKIMAEVLETSVSALTGEV